MSIAAELAGNPKVRRLLELYKDEYTLEHAAHVHYAKQKGKGTKRKPCYVVMTRLSVYILKADDTVDLVRRLRHEDVTTEVLGEGGSLSPSAGREGVLLLRDRGHPEPVTIYGRRTELEKAAAECTRLAKALMRVAATADDRLLPGSAAAAPDALKLAAAGKARRRTNVAPKAAAATAGDAAQDPGPRRFLVQNIVSAEHVDYAAIRSAYSRADESSALRRGLLQFGRDKEKEVEGLCSAHADRFGHKLAGLGAQADWKTEHLQEEIEQVVGSVLQQAEQLSVAGQRTLRARSYSRNVSSTLKVVRQCHECSLLHRRAEALADAGKHYPALLAAEALEMHSRPLQHLDYVRGFLSDALPVLRKRVHTAVVHDLKDWLAESRDRTEDFGRRAMEWAECRLVDETMCGAPRREVFLVELDDDSLEYDSGGEGSIASQSLNAGRAMQFLEASQSVEIDAVHIEDFAESQLWDDKSVGGQPDDEGEGPGAAQFLEELTDLLMDTAPSGDQNAGPLSSPPRVRGPAPSLRTVQNCQRVFDLLGRCGLVDGGAASARRFYVEVRTQQLQILLRQPRSSLAGVRKDDCAWLARLAGFFLVEAIVRRSTSPPLCDDAVLHGWWELAAERVVGWMEEACTGAQQLTDWQSIQSFMDTNRKTCVAVEQLWSVGGSAGSLRLRPLYDGITRLQRAALTALHKDAKDELDCLCLPHVEVEIRFDGPLKPRAEGATSTLPDELRQAVGAAAGVAPEAVVWVNCVDGSDTATCAIPAKPAELSAMKKKMAKSLSVGGVRGSMLTEIDNGERYRLVQHSADPKSERDTAARFLITMSPYCGDPPKCTTTVLRAVQIVDDVISAAFSFGMVDGDDHVLATVASLLIQFTCRIDEEVDRQSKSSAGSVHVATQSVNAAAFDAASLHLAAEFASRTAATYVRDGKLLPFADVRKRLRASQARAQKQACKMVSRQVRDCVAMISAESYTGADAYDASHTPLSDLGNYLASRWNDRKTRLPPGLASQLQRAELAVVDQQLTQIAKSIAFAALPGLHGCRSATLERLAADAALLEQQSEAPVTLTGLNECLKQVGPEAAALDAQPLPPVTAAPPAPRQDAASPAPAAEGEAKAGRGFFGRLGW
eukprot:TRINITY_DN32498_c0_g1_i1.p1 TRINITY_DN32498_c0_g1~~TRINITY_DN32498_c0_g1_i1.p1  ORF type:complete len:1147 (+),score=437.30 TRINITY_DN32498_c0_g1_i1:78-3443(+)